MKVVARLLILIFSVMAIGGHGLVQAVTYIDHVHHGSDTQHRVAGHDLGAGIVMFAVEGGAADAAACIDGASEAPDQYDQAGAHFHVPCCGSFVAVLPSALGTQGLAMSSIEQPIRHSSLRPGELLYPILRPPSEPV